MDGGSIGFVAAFAAGLISFLSPCVLPLIPGYISFMTGLSVGDFQEGHVRVRTVLIPSLMFVAGFSFVFVALGASASVIGSALMKYRAILEPVAGLAVFTLGFFMLGIIKVPWLYGEARMELGKAKAFGRGAALVMGMAFAFGWTPCVGPILGSILALAGSTGSALEGAALLSMYSFGLGLPFILTAVLLGRLTGLLRWLNRRALVINRVAGILLMAVGALIFTGRLSVIAAWLTRVLPTIELWS